MFSGYRTLLLGIRGQDVIRVQCVLRSLVGCRMQFARGLDRNSKLDYYKMFSMYIVTSSLIIDVFFMIFFIRSLVSLEDQN